MDPVVGALALATGAVSLGAARLTAVVDGESVPFMAQLGVAGACIVIALFMLRRSDQRDAVSRATELAAHEAAQAVLHAQLEAERKRADAAEARASKFEERLIEAYRKDLPGEPPAQV